MRHALLAAFCAVVLIAAPALCQNPPGLSYATVLNNVNYQTTLGLFTLGNQMQATFIPPGTDGWVILSTEGGKDLYKWTFKTEDIKPPYVLLNFITTTNLATNESVTNSFELKTTGGYVLNFFLASGKFFTFPFSVQKVPSPDPFLGGDLYFLNGDWSDWGYFYYYNADPGQSLYWKMWLRHQDHSVIRKDAKIFVEVVRAKDKKVICTSRREVQWTLPREWQRFEFEMVYPTEKGYGEYFKTKDLVAGDGAHFLRVTIDGKVFGTYDFTISGGKFQSAGRTERGKADPTTFVEGGRDAFWYCRKK
jgi:hypothetical protein